MQGEVKLAELGRLPDGVLNRDAMLAYRLCFYRDGAGARVMEVEIDARLIMDCQRCLQPVTVAVHQRTLLAITKVTEEIQSLDARYEPFALAGDELSTFTVSGLFRSLPLKSRCYGLFRWADQDISDSRLRSCIVLWVMPRGSARYPDA